MNNPIEPVPEAQFGIQQKVMYPTRVTQKIAPFTIDGVEYKEGAFQYLLCGYGGQRWIAEAELLKHNAR
jgi:hypothetical protein